VSTYSDRRLGLTFGVIAAALLVVDAFLRLLFGVVLLASGHAHAAAGSVGGAVIFLVVGLLIGLFAVLGRTRDSERSLAAGVILIVLALVGWLALGFGGSLLAILAAVFALIAGILFLVAGR
jgi:hypothetical protein